MAGLLLKFDTRLRISHDPRTRMKDSQSDPAQWEDWLGVLGSLAY
jgi:hypothetical protein